MRCLPFTFLVALLAAGCAQKLPARTLPAFASFDDWCKQLKGAQCKGEWPGAKPGTTALGAYRFVVIEASAIENFGGGPSVSFELKTPRGLVYAPMGAIGATGRAGTTTLNIESVTAHAGTLEVRSHARMVSPSGITDTQQASLFIEGTAGVALAHVHLGTNSRDDRGAAKGHFGELKWQDATLISRGTSLKDGEYRLAAP